MKSAKNRKLLAMLAILLVCSLGILGCTGKQTDAHKSVEEICRVMFTYPSENNEKLLDPEFQEIGANKITGEGEEAPGQPDEEPAFLHLLGEMYEGYFTPDAYQNFVNHRYPLEMAILAQENNFTMEFVEAEKVKSASEQDSSESYDVTVKVNDREVIQKITVAADKEGRLTYFEFADQSLRNALMGA